MGSHRPCASVVAPYVYSHTGTPKTVVCWNTARIPSDGESLTPPMAPRPCGGSLHGDYLTVRGDRGPVSYNLAWRIPHGFAGTAPRWLPGRARAHSVVPHHFRVAVRYHLVSERGQHQSQSRIPRCRQASSSAAPAPGESRPDSRSWVRVCRSNGTVHADTVPSLLEATGGFPMPLA